MLGAILGDIIGSPYERPDRNIRKTDFPLFSDRSTFTDDTVMTCAVAQGLMESYGSDDESVRHSLTMNMHALGRAYPARGYGNKFQTWLLVNGAGPYNSYGNGSAMRVSAAGWLYRTLEETLHAAQLTAEVTHNHPEGIKGAQAVAAAIFLARARCEKQDIRNYIMRDFGYDLTPSLAEYRAKSQWNETCQGTVPQALTAFFEGSGFVDTIRKAVSLGGDSDTIAAMAGSIAEAYYGIPENLEKEAYRHLDERLGTIVVQFHRFYYEHSGTPENGWQDTVYYNPDPEIAQMQPLEQSIYEFYHHDEKVREKPDKVFDELVKLMDLDANILISVRQPSKNLEREKRNGGVEVQCIADNQGNILMPMFTSRENLSKRNDYVMTTGINGFLQTLLDAENVEGIIINPFGDNFVLNKGAVRFLIEKQKTIREQEEKSRLRAEASRLGEKAGSTGPAKKTLSVDKPVNPNASKADVPEGFAPEEGEPEFKG